MISKSKVGEDRYLKMAIFLKELFKKDFLKELGYTFGQTEQGIKDNIGMDIDVAQVC